MTRFVILGAGKFGLNAALKLSESHKNHVTVVDIDPVQCKKVNGPKIEVVCREGIHYLAGCMRKRNPPDWIVPVVPLHVAFEWLKTTLAGRFTLKLLPVPEQIVRELPNPVVGEEGQLFISYADFVCPEGCPEPAVTCSFTGKARKGILHSTLEQITFKNYLSVVIHSKQMAPGIGGYRPQALNIARSQVLSSDSPILLSTACKCHGVMHAFQLT